MTPWFETVRVIAKVSPSQHRRLDQIFGMCAELYNANLESWKGAYAWWKEHHNPEAEKFPSEWNLSLFDRMTMFTGVRADHPEWERLSVAVGRGVLARFKRTIQSFYKRCREGKNPGFPRFKPSRRWRSIEMPGTTPSMLVKSDTLKNQLSRTNREKGSRKETAAFQHQEEEAEVVRSGVEKGYRTGPPVRLPPRSLPSHRV